MRDRLLKQLADWHAAHPGRMAIIVLIITVILGAFSTQLSVTMRWSDLLPENDRRTVEFNKIIEEFTSASNIVVVVQGKEESIKAFAETLAPQLQALTDTSRNIAALKKIEKINRQIEKLKPDAYSKIFAIEKEINDQKTNINRSLVSRVDYKVPMDFIREHELMLMKAEDLEDNQAMFTNPNLPELIANLNEVMEKEYVGREESLSTREKEDRAVMFLDGLEYFMKTLHKAAQGESLTESQIESALEHLLFGDPYFLSYDHEALILNVVPTYSVLDLDLVILGVDAVQAAVDETLKQFPDVKAGLTGMMPISRDEMVYGMEGSNVTSIIAIIAIFILLVIAFKMWIAPLFALVSLIIGIWWAMGLTALTVGQLNIMTQMMAVILLGLGVDFSIHFITGFTERRAAGDTIHDALSFTFLKNGKGILTGGLTTMAAFLALLISHSRGMKEMGLVTGLGLFSVLLATFILLPIFLVWRERRIDRRKSDGQTVRRDITFKSLGKLSTDLGRKPILTLCISVVLTLFLLLAARQITFDQNYMHMEPKGIPSVTLQDTITAAFDLSMDYALILANSVEESRELAKAYRSIPTAAMTEDIGRYLPSEEEQTNRRPYLNHIRESVSSIPVKNRITPAEFNKFRNEIERLSWNIMEMQDMAFLGGQDRVDRGCRDLVGFPEDTTGANLMSSFVNWLDAADASSRAGLSAVQPAFASLFKEKTLRMARTDLIHLNDLPSSIIDRYANGDTTGFLVTVYPSDNMWTDMKFMEAFVKDLDSVSDQATGMPPIMVALIKIIGSDGRKALLATLIIVFVLLWMDFRHPKYALMAMLPLAAGVIWMVGLMKVCGMQFTVINVMGLPMIIGIGIDDGVHVVHRWIAEGKKDIYTVFTSTGKAILLTTITTMLAFGSLIFSIWRGFGSLGSAMFLGVGACFLTTMLFLSGMLGWKSRK